MQPSRKGPIGLDLVVPSAAQPQVLDRRAAAATLL
jgi:hypothetical protein